MRKTSANDRFKSFDGDRVGLAVLLSVAVHWALFTYFPDIQAADLGVHGEELAAIELPPEVKIPPPPEQIARPATPRVSAASVDEDITIAPTTFEDNPVDELAPPPRGDDVADVPTYIARDVEPRLINPSEVRRLALRLYPRALREAGISGRVVLWIFVEPDGMPGRTQVQNSSGYLQFDELAMRIAAEMRFSPAMLRDKPVGVWIAIPVSFSTATG